MSVLSVEELGSVCNREVRCELSLSLICLVPLTAGTGAAEVSRQQEEPSCLTKYFSAVWCKISKKKHKKWEGDAVVIVKGKSAVLKDMEGKVIGRGTGYKAKDLENLDQGQTLKIGGKEIEVLGVIQEEDFKSGRCFQAGGETLMETPNFSQSTVKPFCNPLKNICQTKTQGNLLKGSRNCKPRHDPCAPNCLVMLHPTINHQQKFNKANLPIVDVVVDPHIVNYLRPHQREGVIFLYECVMGMRANGRLGAILADEMGLGKTLQCISLIWTLLHQGPYGSKPVIKQVLIVTPGSLVKNWGKEFQKWLGNERIKVFLTDQDHKVEEFINSPLYVVLVISYEMLLRSLDQIQKTEFSLIICDEGHRLKNTSIKTSAALASLPCERRIILTGTPVQNDLQEFYALIDFVNPGILGPLSAYRKVYEEPIIRSQEPSATTEEIELGERRAAELTRLTGLFILRRTQETISKFLPPKKESIIFCRPTALQHELYLRLLRSQMVRSCLQGSLENSPHLICIGALKKLCNHPQLLFKTMKAMARVWRDGQKRTVHIYRLLTTGTIEEKIYQRQISKQGLSGAVVDLSKGSEQIRFSVEELRNLFILHEDSPCVTHDLLECKCMGKKDHQGLPEKLSVQEDDQLDQRRGKLISRKNLSMSQLMQWKHLSGEHESLPSLFLERIKGNITFIFQNVTT
ncbi:DNA repair and recombination protein RAD54B isoform X3 [Sphaerodactylus townsendi]|uniref:DNA repair and recombination protein RAD54B isoform X3 n=1 Tax=Sphaerodactylus townsendi TaxID=933632 RepID=UPI0020262961|nr:DNA repair and recombination protein RAD54B isoform X3 [Sphaerodactylus townsendi]